jgi:hypothetical protein
MDSWPAEAPFTASPDQPLCRALVAIFGISVFMFSGSVIRIRTVFLGRVQHYLAFVQSVHAHGLVYGIFALVGGRCVVAALDEGLYSVVAKKPDNGQDADCDGDDSCSCGRHDSEVARDSAIAVSLW